MFLTSNRIGAFDQAFQSRIHLAIKFHELSIASRRALWEMFITSGLDKKKPQWLSSTTLDKLGKYEINRRQIRNIVRIGFALAMGLGVELSFQHIAVGLNHLQSFDSKFADQSGGSGDGSQYVGEDNVSKRVRTS